jgi:hypothetical protein
LTVEILKSPDDNDWLLARKCALNTVHKETENIPSSELKKKFIASEHSPIRTLRLVWKWIDIPSWVSVHFVRHSKFADHFVQSQRNDRQKEYDRNTAPQNSPVSHIVETNFQEVLAISRVRLCLQASVETRNEWIAFLEELRKTQPELVEMCVPNCVYRAGLCPEVFSKCRYNETEMFRKELEQYSKIFKKEN